MKKLNFLPIALFLIIVVFFFKPFVFYGRLPIPSDTIVGLYHPFRDLFSNDYPNGIPFKNFLITDPVRQQYPWRDLAISLEKKLVLPLWNPYSFSGTPLLANFQSATFYPLNLIFLLLPFNISWSILILLEPLLAGLFLYLYLNNLKLSKWASFLASLTFSFSGFFVAWLEWGTILHAAIWLPLILLAIDKILSCYQPSRISNIKYQISNNQIKNKKFSIFNFQFSIWSIVFIFSLTSSFFAGHLQIFFYLFIFTIIYFVVRWFQYGKIFNILFAFLIFIILFLILTSIQWIPTMQFILQSARGIDQANWQKEGWFIPWQHLIQFVAPDFFGNPSTLNYWGVWNYGEFVGYIGILPLIVAVFALFFRRDKKTFFFGTIFFMSLIFSLPNFFAKLLYVLNIPFLSTTQPTRLLFITDLSLAVLSALGFDYFLKSNKKNEIFYPLGFIGTIFIGLWIFVLLGKDVFNSLSAENFSVARQNLFFPTALLTISAIFLIILRISRMLKFTLMIYIIIVAVMIFDLLRFGSKFTPFTDRRYLFPQTKILSFLQDKKGQFRIMTTDSRILPPNFSIMYHLQSVDGYDPLYLRRYGELIAASERKTPNIDPPFGFNRIINPHNYDSKIMDLLGVRYVLSLSDLQSPKLKKVFQEGQTRVYENKAVFPRAFFVREVKRVENKVQAIHALFDPSFNLKTTAVIEALLPSAENLSVGRADIIYYSPNKVVIETEVNQQGFLVLTDAYYSTWKTRIYLSDEALKDTPLGNSFSQNGTAIFRTDYNFRGILVPKGKNIIEFYVTLF